MQVMSVPTTTAAATAKPVAKPGPTGSGALSLPVSSMPPQPGAYSPASAPPKPIGGYYVPTVGGYYFLPVWGPAPGPTAPANTTVPGAQPLSQPALGEPAAAPQTATNGHSATASDIPPDDVLYKQFKALLEKNPKMRELINNPALMQISSLIDDPNGAKTLVVDALSKSPMGKSIAKLPKPLRNMLEKLALTASPTEFDDAVKTMFTKIA